MCLFCSGRVTTQISVVKTDMERFAITWDIDKWWLYLVDLQKSGRPHENPGNNLRYDLEIFLIKALNNRMSWEEIVDTPSASDGQPEAHDGQQTLTRIKGRSRYNLVRQENFDRHERDHVKEDDGLLAKVIRHVHMPTAFDILISYRTITGQLQILHPHYRRQHVVI